MSTSISLTYVLPTNSIEIQLFVIYTGTISVNWGDGTGAQNYTNAGNPSHTYSNSGTYTITIGSYSQGPVSITQLGYLNNVATGIQYLTVCNSFGTNLGLTSLSGAFSGATSLVNVPSNIPSTVLSTSFMFSGATSFNDANISGWTMTNVTNISVMFGGATAFNRDISSWDVTNVTNMSDMFNGATSFNNGDSGNNGAKPLTWSTKTSKVTTMSGTFAQAPGFNQDVSSWDVSNVQNMTYMFQAAYLFNNGDAGNNSAKSLSSWNTGKVTDMTQMFNSARVFNQSVSTWNVGLVQNMGNMFLNAALFNKEITNWNIVNIQNIGGMFKNATAFNNGDIGNNAAKPLSWSTKTQNLTSLNSLFSGASSFNQDISSWSVGNVQDMKETFIGAPLFNQNISAWDVTKVTNMESTFGGATAFNQNIANWNIVNVINMTGMLQLSGLSKYNYNSATNFDSILNGWATKMVKNNVTLGQQLYYTSAGLASYNLLTNPQGYNWTIQATFVTLSYTPTTVNNSVGFTLNYINSGRSSISGHSYKLIRNSSPGTTLSTFTGDGSQNYVFNGSVLSTVGANLLSIIDTTDTNNLVTIDNSIIVTINSDNIICFKEDSTILCLIDGLEKYIPVQDIRSGTLVKTLVHGYIPVDLIGTSKIYNPSNTLRSKERLYKCPMSSYPELSHDLIITGCHSILVLDEMTDEYKGKTKELLGSVFITDNKYRLMACLDERAITYEEEGVFNIWHFALEHDDIYMNYGIFANGGLLVETTSKRMLTQYSGMEIIL